MKTKEKRPCTKEVTEAKGYCKNTSFSLKSNVLFEKGFCNG